MSLREVEIPIHSKADATEAGTPIISRKSMFREDLQGIRTIAIISVMLFHFYPDAYPNGYVGVDQFFVLSGYLMSMMSEREEQFGKKQILKFYYRRTKRILPSYLLMIFLALLVMQLLHFDNLRYITFLSAKDAMMFLTNVEATNSLKRYENKLTEAEDVFTHTWSIAAEMQFYTIFPVIIVIFKMLPERVAMWSLAAIGALSLYFHITLPDTMAFNLVHARLWQFVLGIYVHQMTKNAWSSAYSEMSMENIYASKECYGICLLGSLYIGLFILKGVHPLTIRIASTFLTAGLILFYPSGDVHFMSSKRFTYIGYISYSLYLVHWPIYIFIKQAHLDNDVGLLSGIAIALLVAVLFTELFEKAFSKADVKTTLCIIAFLYSINILFIYTHDDHESLLKDMNWSLSLFTPKCWNNNSDSNELCEIPFDSIKLTTEQILQCNNFFSVSDVPLLSYERCSYRQNYMKPWGWCDLPTKSNAIRHKILVLGNSYAANQGRIVYEMCRSASVEIKQFTIGGCEVLSNTSIYGHCGNSQIRYFDAANEYKPDTLFVIARYMDMLDAPEEEPSAAENIVQGAARILKKFSEVTSDQIFVLNAIPRPLVDFDVRYNEAFQKGQILNSAKMLNTTSDSRRGRRRITQAVSTCSKCTIIDYEPIFEVDGIFQLYDVKSHVAFVNGYFHLTPFGLHKLRPLFKNICTHINSSGST